jgi:citrate lyase subunit alpha/citrate CoA-transferase
LDEVTTLCGPGELIDVVATERGVCINPRRRDLVDAMAGSRVPLLDIHDLKREVERICGGAPARPAFGEQVVAAIQWVDGTTIDSVRAT